MRLINCYGCALCWRHRKGLQPMTQYDSATCWYQICANCGMKLIEHEHGQAPARARCSGFKLEKDVKKNWTKKECTSCHGNGYKMKKVIKKKH